MEEQVITRLQALGHPKRLAIFRLLMRRYPDRVAAGELGAALDLRPSTLSTYLASLLQAGLITQTRAGTSLRYQLDMTATRQSFDYLLNDCCRGRPEICQPDPIFAPIGQRPMPDHSYKVLFICTGNSARSIFAETLLRELGGDRFTAYSAGTLPASELNPFAVRLLTEKGHDITPLRAKNIAEMQAPEAPDFDFVFTVCDQAANEDCPAWPGQPISAHWGLPDPVKATGTDAQKSLAFQEVYGALRNRITAFTALPFDALDRAGLQRALDHLARTEELQ